MKTEVDSLDASEISREKDESEGGGDENVERGNWSGSMDFLLSLLGYAVGLGNVWRFPYLCYRHGGGAFLIPYAVMLVFIGMPLFFMEIALGQFTSRGPTTCWEFAPLFQGLGLAQLVVSAEVAIYYNIIIAWSLFYLFASFIHVTGLPWQYCHNPWNTEFCYWNVPDVACNETSSVRYSNGTCSNGTSLVGLWDVRVFENATRHKRTSPSEEYYNQRVLSLSSGIDDFGPVKWDLVLSLLLAWVISFLCMAKGIKTTGKVVYFTALFPYVVLVILFFRGVTLPNAGEGIIFYIYPDFNRLKDARVWSDAATQIFFAMNNSYGGVIALASYSRFHSPCLRDTVLVSLCNFATGIFAGFVIFSFLGFMAGTMSTTVDAVVDSGPGLAFIVYPDAVTRMPASPLWAILFFMMLLTLGLDSQFAMLETVLTSILDLFPSVRIHKTKIILSLCVVLFLLGLPMCAHGGNYLLQLMDTYCSGWGLLLIGIIECISISWVYGCSRFLDDIRVMLGKKQSIWWRLCWQFFTPVLILFILIFTWADYTPATYGSYRFPAWADVMGWMITFSSVVWIPIVAVYKVCREFDGTVCERLRNLSLPSIYWGPALVKHRKLIDYVDGFVVDPWNTTDPSARATVNHKDLYHRSVNITVGQSLSSASVISVPPPAFDASGPRFGRSRSETSFGGQSVRTFESVV